MQTNEFKEITWTNEKVERIWQYYGTNQGVKYFSEQSGRDVIKIAKRKISFKGKILDYGCGNGHLIGYLLEYKNIEVSGCDHSKQSVELVNQQFTGKSNFVNCYTMEQMKTLPDESFDVIFFLETIEHLINEQYQLTLNELNRLLKKNGYLIITTPNNENLEAAKVACPDCGCVFHRFQHVRSFSKKSITEEMQKFNFNLVFSRSYDFHIVKTNFLVYLATIFYHFIYSQFLTNLLYIGKKIK